MPSDELRRTHLIAICHALTTYLENGHNARIKTVVDDEALAALPEQLRGDAGIVFAIEDWQAFRRILEPGSE